MTGNAMAVNKHRILPIPSIATAKLLPNSGIQSASVRSAASELKTVRADKVTISVAIDDNNAPAFTAHSDLIKNERVPNTRGINISNTGTINYFLIKN